METKNTNELRGPPSTIENVLNNFRRGATPSWKTVLTYVAAYATLSVGFVGCASLRNCHTMPDVFQKQNVPGYIQLNGDEDPAFYDNNPGQEDPMSDLDGNYGSIQSNQFPAEHVFPCPISFK